MPIANTLKVLSGGFRTAWFMLLDGDGYFAGSTGSLTAGATGSGGYYMDGVKSAAYKGGEPLVLLGTGEDQPLGQLIEPPQTLPAFDMTGSIGDLTLDALTQNTKNMNQSNVTYGVIQPYLPNYVDGALVFLRLSMSRDAATLGQGNWDGVMFPKVKLVPKSSDGAAEKKVTDFRRHVICNPSTIMPNGIPINAANFLTTNGVEFPFSAPNKIMMYGWKGNAALTAFNLPQSAIPATNLLAYGQPAFTTIEGVVTAPTSIVLTGTNYVFTFASPPAANARIITTVEYQ